MKKLLNYLFSNNALYILAFGICSSLVVSNTFENSYIFGFIVFILFIVSGLFLMLIKKLKKQYLIIFLYILFITISIILIEYFLYYYVRNLYNAYSIYLPLIIVTVFLPNILLNIKIKNNLNFKNNLKYGVGFLIAVSIFGIIREILGSGTLTLMNNISVLTGYRSVINIFNNDVLPNAIFRNPSGGLILLGITICIINYIRGDNNG